MNINVSSVFSQGDNFTIGTHNGIFHVDEVVACAILALINADKSIHIVRTRDVDLLNKCDICVDIGGGEFDHHMPGFNKARENGIKYASAGLVWKQYGRQLIEQILIEKYDRLLCDVDNAFELIDSKHISPVDCVDNGIANADHIFSFIPCFLPSWLNTTADEFNRKFNNVLLTTIDVLKEAIQDTINKLTAKEKIIWNYKNKDYFQDGILEIPSQTMEWSETVIKINESVQSEPINFVIFPYPNGGWAAQCVPPSKERMFKQRIPFPESWAGQTSKLPEMSGIEDALFCHNGRFFARAASRESVIKMCNIATELNT